MNIEAIIAAAAGLISGTLVALVAGLALRRALRAMSDADDEPMVGHRPRVDRQREAQPCGVTGLTSVKDESMIGGTGGKA